MVRRILPLLALAAVMGCATLGQKKPPPAERIEAFLLDQRGPFPEHILPPAASVESVTISPETVTIDLDYRIQREPIRMDTDDRILDALRPLVDEVAPGAQIVLTTEGQLLDSFVPRSHGGSGPARDPGDELAPPPGPALVRPAERAGPAPTRGLEGRHVAMWPSHGWYFDEGAGRWQWQRTRQYTTVEDMLPMGYVLPFIAPMLENAGAVTLIPRERDLQMNEVIVDNAAGAEINGPWRVDDTEGFEAGHEVLPKDFNPHATGTNHIATTVPALSRMIAPQAIYVPDIPEAGDYAITVSFIADATRAPDARYIIRHAGGTSTVLVNQRMHGHGWVYLGTYSFEAGSHPDSGAVILDARSESPGTTVSADAVRFGGGMGHVAVEGVTSGMPRFAEAAHYFMQYSGVPAEHTWQLDKWNEYTQDYASRGEWVNYLHGAPNGPNGARDLPGGQVPIDISLAFHTDAGVKDGITGTLMIYRSVGDEGPEDTHFPDGRPRGLNREYGDILQTQIVDDIQATWGPDWVRRDLHDRSLAECRRPNVPSLILELAAHQNFDDSTALNDPDFRFMASRAIYKGMLRFIATEAGFDPIIQPLPPTAFAVEASGPGAYTLAWEAQPDPLEPTADPTGYLVHVREGGPVGWRWNVARGGGFDEPIFTESTSILIEGLDPEAMHSFRVTAVNEGGESFPSPTLAAAWGGRDAPEVLVVDAFDRVATPHQVDIEGEREGFDRHVDRGVGFGVNMGQIGEQVFYDPSVYWVGSTYLTNDFPGHGSSLGDMQASLEMGNLFDNAALHAAPLHALGYTVHAATDDALEARGWGRTRPALVDWVLGEEKTVEPPRWAQAAGVRGPQFAALPESHQALIADLLAGGGQLILSGSHWATDAVDPGGDALNASGEAFLRDVLGVRWQHWKGSDDGAVRLAARSPFEGLEPFAFEAGLGEGVHYAAESPDAIEPAGDYEGTTALRYQQTRFGAAVVTPGRSVCFGFPLESVADETVRAELLRRAIQELRIEN